MCRRSRVSSAQARLTGSRLRSLGRAGGSAGSRLAADATAGSTSRAAGRGIGIATPTATERMPVVSGVIARSASPTGTSSGPLSGAR